MKLRPAQAADAPALAQIHVQCWREAYPGLISTAFLAQISTAKREEIWRSRLASPGGRFDFAAEIEGRVVGFCSGGPLRTQWENGQPFPPHLMQSFDGELYAAYLLRAHYRLGHGRAMFGQVAAELKRRGYRSMLAWMLKGNSAAKFYEALGGREVGRKNIMIDREHEEIAYGWDRL